MTALEQLGLLKMDFLGLRNLTVIADTQQYIRTDDPGFDIEKIPLDDKETYAMMGKGQTDGVFQFESDGMKNVLRQFGPESIEDLTAILSLYRPGPMDSIPKYIHNRHHPEDITYDTPLLKPILDVTYGCIVYQEQVMQVFRKLAGYSLGRADIVRRAMAKKKHAVMERERNFFLYGEKDENGKVVCPGAIANGVSEEAAQKIFDDMSSFSSYAFNKAHAAAYAFVAYRTAYLKCHYPAEYFAALMTGMMDSLSKISLYTADCKKQGIAILPPSVNASREGFTPDHGNIRFGLLAIKNLGVGLIERLIRERETGGPYTSLYDFCLRNASREMNRKALEGLIKSGALDGLDLNRREMLFNLDGVLAAAERERKHSADGQMDLFGEIGEEMNFQPEHVPEMPEETRLLLEKEATGLYLSGHPMKEYAAYLEQPGITRIGDIAAKKIPDGKRIAVAGIVSELKTRQLKNNNLLATGILEDTTGSVNITVFANAYTEFKPVLSSGKPILMRGKISEHEDRETELLCERAELLPDTAKGAATKPAFASGLYLQIPHTDCPEMERVKQILAESPGTTRVFLYCTDTKRKLEAPPALRVGNVAQIMSKLEGLLGAKNVKYIK